MSGAVPAVSVLMPVRNEARNVVAAVQSVLRQSEPDVEVLVLDGGSTDDTAALVRELALADRRVRLLDNPQRTIPYALNVGLAAARGPLVARVDAHASVSDTYLERGAALLASRPDVVAVGGLRIGVGHSAAGRAVALALSSRFGVGDSINHYADTAQQTDHASFGVYRVSAVRAVGGWDVGLRVNEDVDLDHRLQLAGHAIEFDPQMHIYWLVQDSVRDFSRQYRRYGRGKAAMVRKNGRAAVRVRHLVPPALVTTLLAAGALGATGRWRPALGLVAPYAAAVTAVSLRTDRGDGVDGPAPAAATLAACFVAMHVSWGVGFLEGMLLGSEPVAASTRERVDG